MCGCSEGITTQTSSIRGVKSTISTLLARKGASSTAIGYIKIRMSSGLDNMMRLFQSNCINS